MEVLEYPRGGRDAAANVHDGLSRGDLCLQDKLQVVYYFDQQIVYYIVNLRGQEGRPEEQ